MQILHENDDCCFAASGRHDKLLRYEANVRAELQALRGGWFTVVADNHTHHEVCPQDKHLITAALVGPFRPGSAQWEQLPCDILHASGGACPEPHPQAKGGLANRWWEDDAGSDGLPSSPTPLSQLV